MKTHFSFFQVNALIALGMVLGMLPTSLAYSAANASRFDLGIGAGWGYGKAGAADDSVSSRSTNWMTFGIAPGVHLGDFVIGLNGSYSIIGQNTAVADTGNTNLRGSGYLVGPFVAYRMTSLIITGGVDLLGKYSLGEKTEGGSSSSYSKPFGLRLDVGYFLGENASVDAYYHRVSYGENTIAATTSTLTDGKMQIWAAGLAFNYYLGIF